MDACYPQHRFGCSDRGDDQLGLRAARRLRVALPEWIRVQEDTAAGARLTEGCEGTDRLVLIEAFEATPGGPRGSHLRLS